jgi:hypothetical protein
MELDVEELEFRLEDLGRLAFRVPVEAAWRLEIAVGAPEAQLGAGEEWAVAIAAFDRSEPDAGDAGAESADGTDAAPVQDGAPPDAPDPAPW